MAFQVITRADARAQGLKRYFTGQSCKYGHLTERLVSNLTCIECVRLKSAKEYPGRDKAKEKKRLSAFRAANRQKINAKSREDNAKPKTKARRAAWFQLNKQRICDKRRAQYAENPEKRLSGNQRWIDANPERFAEQMRIHARKRRAQKRGSGGTHTAADLAAIFKAQGGRCAYCRADLSRKKKHVDHIVPLKRGGSNGRKNLQYLCAPCNQSKSAKHPIDYARSIGLLL